MNISSIHLFNRFKSLLNQKGAIESWVIFFSCAVTYFASGQNITSGDSIPNSLLAFNWLFNGRLDFDNFRNGIFYAGDAATAVRPLPHFFNESSSGYLNSVYPIGSAIVSFPIYFCFYLLLLIFHPQGSAIDITSASFGGLRILSERIAAALLASLSVVLFYRLSRLKVERSIALISTFIFAFATETWAISSQSLWQHGVSNLLLIGCILCLWQANRAHDRTKNLLILNAGLLCGLSLTVRPTNIIFVLMIAIYSLFAYRRRVIFLVLGLPTALISLAWNLYYFRVPGGGYQMVGPGLYDYSLNQFITSFVGLLFSPSRGLFVYTPIVVMCIPGFIQIVQRWKQKDEKLIILLFLSCCVTFVQYCFFRVWWAGWSYGPRFMTDFMPVLCLMLNYTIAQYVRQSAQLGRSLVHWKSAIFAALVAFSVFAQVVGVFAEPYWDAIPISVDVQSNALGSTSRLWQLQDTQIERSFQNIIYRLTRPTQGPGYAAGFSGKVLQVRDQDQRVLPAQLTVPAGTTTQLTATVQNTGTSPWFSYETGAVNTGAAQVLVTMFDDNNQQVRQQQLYVSGQPLPGKTATAIGVINFPERAGTYRITFSLFAKNVTAPDFASVLTVEARIVPRS
ncbi:glycosyltransferase family 39 protein [Leptolyngbya sp. FACHB-17]|uniref:glycosyltransferase family 39 protein n=1 Tax=unclassified Leptolyngbya TaxID=2650499 RepID=UPI0016807DAC|nr:glycosyltransferase family 39 protein [Leptolyngbya sp. FACHB-17]MBD2082794.1 glycosyltransferase family 39 protein [Leptolyngbya sp. FACHB-17]